MLLHYHRRSLLKNIASHFICSQKSSPVIRLRGSATSHFQVRDHSQRDSRYVSFINISGIFAKGHRKIIVIMNSPLVTRKSDHLRVTHCSLFSVASLPPSSTSLSPLSILQIHMAVCSMRCPPHGWELAGYP